MAGWIKISRDIQTHWIYQDSEKLKWWIDLLFLANYEDKEVVIKFKVFECKRGQLLYSLSSLSQRWKVSKSVVNNFLEMLRKQNMIETQNETVTTRITICNYDTYQQSENGNETQTKRKPNANRTGDNTTKEIQEIQEGKENKKTNLYPDFFIDEIYNLYPAKCLIKNTSTGKSSKDKDKIKTILKTKTPEELKSIINRYVSECVSGKTFMKNFSTFLNNLPDFSTGNANEEKKLSRVKYKYYGETVTRPRHVFEREQKDFGADNVIFIQNVE